MKAYFAAMSALICLALFWYGYTYSLTEQAFFIQGWIGAAIPAAAGAWLFAAGWITARLG